MTQWWGCTWKTSIWKCWVTVWSLSSSEPFFFFCTDERAGVKGNCVLLLVYCQNWVWTILGEKKKSNWNCNYTSIFTVWWIRTSTTWDEVQKQTPLQYIPTQGWKYKKLHCVAQLCGAPRCPWCTCTTLTGPTCLHPQTVFCPLLSYFASYLHFLCS